MIKELQIPSSLGFCKKCFRTRREGSSYCGQCQDEPERMMIFISDDEFPLTNEALKAFDLSYTDIKQVCFAYGNIIYTPTGEISFSLLAHELTHLFQQLRIGRNKWWTKYFKDKKFRLKQEMEAYRQQYKIYKQNKPESAEEVLNKIAGDLSGRLYGYVIGFEEAKKLISQED